MIASNSTNASRIIPLEKVGIPLTYMGWSEGHWEGDTPVVDVTGLSEDASVRLSSLPNARFDQAGLRVQENALIPHLLWLHHRRHSRFGHYFA